MTPEEALIDAISREAERVPAQYRDSLGFGDPAEVAAAILSGERNQGLDNLLFHLQASDPQGDFSDSPDWSMYQRLALRGYPGRSWTEDQVAELGRDPRPLEFSPGGKDYYDYVQRRELIGKVLSGEPTSTAAWVGKQNVGAERQGFADDYESSIAASYAPSWSWESLQSPETYLGYYMTKMGPVLSDAFSQASDSNLAGETTGILDGLVDEGMGNAAVRSSGSDWNRVNPVMRGGGSGMERDRRLDEMRGAWGDSQGSSAHDTLRKATGIDSTKIPYLGRLATGAMSLGNGLLDGSFGASPLGKGTFAAKIGQELLEEGVTDGGINAVVDVLGGDQRPRGESDSAFQQRFSDQQANKKKAIKKLEAGDRDVYHPKTYLWEALTGPSKTVQSGPSTGGW